jgi:opacity protein-like surface antigen
MTLRAISLGMAVGSAIGAALALPGAALAQTPTPVYDSSGAWGLSNAGVPPGPYLKLGGGHSWGASSRFDDSWLYGGGVGYRFAPWFRSDVTFDYRPDFHDSDYGNARFHNWSAMLNGYVDFNVPPIRPLIPYIGAGAGIAQNKLNGTTVTVGGTQVASITGSTKDQFAWQAMAGASWYFTPTLALDVGYRYFHGGSAESGVATGFPTHSGDFDTHEIVGYLRFGF